MVYLVKHFLAALLITSALASPIPHREPSRSPSSKELKLSPEFDSDKSDTHSEKSDTDSDTDSLFDEKHTPSSLSEKHGEWAKNWTPSDARFEPLPHQPAEMAEGSKAGLTRTLDAARAKLAVKVEKQKARRLEAEELAIEAEARPRRRPRPRRFPNPSLYPDRTTFTWIDGKLLILKVADPKSDAKRTRYTLETVQTNGTAVFTKAPWYLQWPVPFDIMAKGNDVYVERPPTSMTRRLGKLRKKKQSRRAKWTEFDYKRACTPPKSHLCDKLKLENESQRVGESTLPFETGHVAGQSATVNGVLNE